MPKLFSIDSPRSTRLAVWSLTETEEELSLTLSRLEKTQRHRLSQINSPLQRAAFWSLRHLMLDVGLDPLSVYYSPNGRPMVYHKGWVSLSHTHKYTALAWNPEVPVGVDVEAQRPQILRIAHKFSPPKVAPDSYSVEELTDLWCAKEALYKSADVPGISFLHGLEVAPCAPGMEHALGVIHTDKDLPCDVSFYRWEDQHLALAEHIK